MKDLRGFLAMIWTIRENDRPRLLTRATFAALVFMSLNSPSGAQNSVWWYYCSDTHQFYPYTQQCSHWRRVRPYHAVPLEHQPRNILPPQEQQPDSSAAQDAQPASPQVQTPEQEQSDGASQGTAQPNPPPADSQQEQTQTPDESQPDAKKQTEPARQPPMAEIVPTPNDSNADSSAVSPQLVLLLIVALLVGGVAVVVGYKSHTRNVRTTKVLEVTDATVTQHKRALIRRRFQTVREDPYGNVLLDAWKKELVYFFEMVLDPAVRRIGTNEYTLYVSMRPGLLLTVAEQIEHDANSTQNFTFGPNLSPTDYEQLCAEQLRKAGWSANTTKASGDQGTDIIAEKNGQRLVVQCKLYSSPVGNKAVQEIATARMHEQANWAVVVSNASYTTPAQQLAATNAVLLLHHSDLGSIDEILAARQGSLQVSPLSDAIWPEAGAQPA